MNNNNTSRRRRINVHALAEKLCCHPTTVKRKIKNPPPGFPTPVMLLGKYTFDEAEADAYVAAETRAQRQSQNGPGVNQPAANADAE